MNGTMPDMVRIRPTFPVLLGDTAREDTILPYSGWAVSSHDSIQCTAKLVGTSKNYPFAVWTDLLP